jgi:hypothetical protein
MVGRCSKQDPKTGTQTFQWSTNIVWNLWKERNRRIFEKEFKTAQQVASMTKEDIVQRCMAFSFAG